VNTRFLDGASGFYSIEDDEILVAAVAHMRRAPEYWLKK